MSVVVELPDVTVVEDGGEDVVDTSFDEEAVLVELTLEVEDVPLAVLDEPEPEGLFANWMNIVPTPLSVSVPAASFK